jgi:hypothetical protein
MKGLLLTVLAGLTALAGCQDDSGRILPKSPAGAGDPEGEWSILLLAVQDPLQHVQLATDYKRLLEDRLGWKGLFVIHKGGHSELYWGRYRTSKDAQPNLRIAKAHTTEAGTKPFAQAIVMPLPGADVGPQEYNLKNAPGAYTLLVAVFQDDPERNYLGRKQRAVDYCQRLRKGNYEAYFYHKATGSQVTIGSFGPSAINIRKDPKGDELEILDPRIRQLQQDFPELAVNGSGVNDLAWDTQAQKMVRIPKKTYLIRIPRGDQANAP